MAVSAKYFRFLDTAIDVYFGIALFILFQEFPGFGQVPLAILFFHLMLFMIFTWWEFRTVEQIPKHYFVDFIFLGLELFALTQAIFYLHDVRAYLGWLVGFLALDILDNLIDRRMHKPGKAERHFLNFFLIDDVILASFYGLALLFVDRLSIFSAIAVVLPFVVSVYLSVLFRTTELKARYPS
ncbi:MAG: hypothetical protein U0514_02400 [Candidatus Andersenbacteria bacterium]